jgi:hypothetical protein
MKFIIIFLMLFSCSRKPNYSHDDMAEMQVKARFYCNSFFETKIFKRPGDKLTFEALMQGFCKDMNLSRFEKNIGEWHRNEKQVYFGENDPRNESKSEISSDAFIMLLHAFLSFPNADSLMKVNNIIQYGNSHDWIMGDGPKKLTSSKELKTIYERLRDYLNNNKGYYGTDDALPILSGFRGYLLTMYIYANVRMKSTVSDFEIQALRIMDSENRIATALVNNYDGISNQDIADFLLDKKNFPSHYTPIDDGVYGWGSCPRIVYYMVVYNAIGGTL